MLSLERKNTLALKAQRYADSLTDERVLSYLASRGITSFMAKQWSLGLVPEGEMYGGRLSIPYLVPTGCVGIKYRALNGEKAKYIKEAGTGEHLFNARALRSAGEVVLTEGELDALCVQAYCGIPAVGYPGASAWDSRDPESPAHYWPLCFEGAGRVFVVADGDDPGRQAAERVAEKIGWSARVIDLGDDYDSNKYIAEHGAQAFIERLYK